MVDPPGEPTDTAMADVTPTRSLDERRHHYLREHNYAVILGLLAVWTLLVAYSYQWNRSHLFDETVALARREAEALWNKDQAFRQWGTRHGGVYVRPSEWSPPNPFLDHLPDRDLETTDGVKLTLVNPAYMMRQVTELFDETYGIKGRITGLRQLNPDNAPDDWEREVLLRWTSGDVQDVTAQTQIGGRPFLRFMRPMYMVDGCDKCHAVLGYKTGDLRGGVSVSIPLTPYFDAAADTLNSILATHVAVWLLGTASLFVFALSVRRKQRERRQHLAQLERAALYDALTGLPTRMLLHDRIGHAIRSLGRRPGQSVAVCFIDLDRFKHINDTYGHAVGDGLLVAVSQILQHAVRPNDTVGRLGGDEYVVLLNGVEDAGDASAIMERLLTALREPVNVAGQAVQIDASIGIAMSNLATDTAETLIRHADIAMFRAKRDSGQRIAVFDTSMHEHIRELTETEAALRSALKNDEFMVYYQPIVSSRSRRIAGFEALLRWRHPQLGMVPPDHFVPIAEEIGEIHAIGAWVIEQACEQIAAWRTHFDDGALQISVNLSALQLLDPEFLDKVRNTTTRAGVDPSQLCLEITETALVRDQAGVTDCLGRLRDFGCRLAADDFGTGYSSLTYLQRYRFDAFKIDKQFVQDDSESSTGSKLCKALIGLADDLGMIVVAEGVETSDQFDRLRDMGCDRMQGYYFSRPLPPAEINALLQRGLHRDNTRLAAHSAAA